MLVDQLETPDIKRNGEKEINLRKEAGIGTIEWKTRFQAICAKTIQHHNMKT
jgi:hypothetical protein